MNDIREYNGYFVFSEITDEQLAYIVKIFKDEDFEVDISNKSLEFMSAGKDNDRLILTIFKEVASVLKDAKGELKCEIDDEQVDPHFEYFSIKRGELLMQRGWVVRDKEKHVV